LPTFVIAAFSLVNLSKQGAEIISLVQAISPPKPLTEQRKVMLGE
jgi:hypothetical protein